MRALLILLLVLWQQQAQANDPPDLPPTAMVERVLAGYPGVLAAQATIRLEQANRERLAAGIYETTLRLDHQRRSVAGDARASYGEWGVALERPLRLPAKARLDERLGEAGVEGARLALGDARHEASRLLLASWFDFLRAMRLLASKRAQRDALAATREAVAKRVAAGDAPRLAQAHAEAALAQAEAEIAQAEFALEKARAELVRRFPGLELPAAVPVVEPPRLEGDAETWIERILDHNHELAVARAETRRARFSVARAEADLLPDPIVGLRYARERGGEERITGLSIAWPLGGRARSAHVEAARAQAALAASREAQVEMRLRLEAENRYHQARSAWQSYLEARKAAEALQRIADLSHRAYTLGEADLGEVLLARRQAAEALAAAELARLSAAEAVYRLRLDAHALWPVSAEEHAHE